MACGASSYDSSTLRAPSWCFVFFVVSLARKRAGRNFPRSRRPQSRLAVLVEEKAWMVKVRPTMTGLISRASPEAVILTGRLSCRNGINPGIIPHCRFCLSPVAHHSRLIPLPVPVLDRLALVLLLAPLSDPQQ